jgi:hypothetical protein
MSLDIMANIKRLAVTWDFWKVITPTPYFRTKIKSLQEFPNLEELVFVLVVDREDDISDYRLSCRKILEKLV